MLPTARRSHRGRRRAGRRRPGPAGAWGRWGESHHDQTLNTHAELTTGVSTRLGTVQYSTDVPISTASANMVLYTFLNVLGSNISITGHIVWIMKRFVYRSFLVGVRLISQMLKLAPNSSTAAKKRRRRRCAALLCALTTLAGLIIPYFFPCPLSGIQISSGV